MLKKIFALVAVAAFIGTAALADDKKPGLVTQTGEQIKKGAGAVVHGSEAVVKKGAHAVKKGAEMTGEGVKAGAKKTGELGKAIVKGTEAAGKNTLKGAEKLGAGAKDLVHKDNTAKPKQ